MHVWVAYNNAILEIKEGQRQRIENYRYIHDLPLFDFIFLVPWTKHYEDAEFAHDDKLTHNVWEELRRFSKEFKQPA